MDLSPEYIAGFLDGEGCIQVIRQRKSDRISWSYRLSVEVVNTYEPIVRALYERYGGVFGQYRASPRRKKRTYYWHATGRRAGAVLEDLAPFLVEKQRQAHIGLEFLSAITPTPKAKVGTPVPIEENALREGYYLAIRQAKQQDDVSSSLVKHNHLQRGVWSCT